jgi:hypothetical protein
MRIAFVVASVLVVVATPSEASKSCMSQAEARQHFASDHLYWHGPDHCWDATSPRHRQIEGRRKTPVQAAQQQNSDRPKWRDSMSEMLPDDELVKSPAPLKPLDVEYRESDAAAIGKPWADRWVDVGPIQPRVVVHQVRSVLLPPESVAAPSPVLMVSARNVVLFLLIGFMTIMTIMTLWTVGSLYRQEA